VLVYSEVEIIRTYTINIFPEFQGHFVLICYVLNMKWGPRKGSIIWSEQLSARGRHFTQQNLILVINDKLFIQCKFNT